MPPTVAVVVLTAVVNSGSVVSLRCRQLHGSKPKAWLTQDVLGLGHMMLSLIQSHASGLGPADAMDVKPPDLQKL